MSASDVAAALTVKLDEIAQAGAHAVLASLSMEMLTADPIFRIEARVQRKTRTLVFTEAEAFAASGVRVACASAVHRIVENT